MGMSDEHKILMNGSGGTPSDIESTLKLRDDNASLMTPNRDPFNGIALQVHTFPENLVPGRPVLVVLNGPAHCRQIRRRGFDGVEGIGEGWE